jgi:MFS family permease
MRQQRPTNVSKTKRTSLFLVLLLAACARPRDMRERFNGHAEAINVFEIGAETRTPYGFFPPQGVFTMRQTITPQEETNCVYASMLATFEIRWDGRLIGTNASGAIDNFFPIPRELTGAGAHTIEIRVTVPKRRTGWFHGVATGNIETMMRTRIASQVLPLSGLALFLVVAVYYLALAVGSRRRAPAIAFALLCIAAALLALAETWRWIVGYDWHYHDVRLSIVTALTFAVSLLLPLFLVLELNLSRPRIWTAVLFATLAATFTVPASSDTRCLVLFWMALAFSAAAVIAAIPAHRQRVIPSAAAVAILFVAMINGGYGFGDNTFFIAFCLVIACLLVSLAIEQRRDLLRAARLEIQLLQRTIEPHFVMNTLTAVMEWIEEDPAIGARFLEAFAEELRLFATIARERLISVAQEIALCRSHLTVMGCRKGKRFHLQTEAVDQSAAVPPAIFHTLVENAITHNRYNTEDVRFVLAQSSDNGRRRYVFDAPVSESAETTNGDGTGLRYVKARLEESYPGRWSLDAARFGSNWRTTIEVPA